MDIIFFATSSKTMVNTKNKGKFYKKIKFSNMKGRKEGNKIKDILYSQRKATGKTLLLTKV